MIVCLIVCLLAGLCKYYWLVQTDLDHHLDTKKKFEFSHRLIIRGFCGGLRPLECFEYIFSRTSKNSQLFLIFCYFKTLKTLKKPQERCPFLQNCCQLTSEPVH